MVSRRLAVGAFNLSLVRGCAHYCKLNSPREPRGLGVTAAGGTVICPPRAARVYVRERGGEGRSLSLSVKNGRGTRCPSPWIQDLWLAVQRQRCDLYSK